MEEVQYYTHEYVDSTIIPALDGGVIKSDSSVDEVTHAGLMEAAAALRQREGFSKSSQVGEVDIVDPFLFPFAWETTYLLQNGWVPPSDCIVRCGDGAVAKMPPEEDCKEPDHGRYRNDMTYSRRFQWLPFDVKFDHSGSGASRYPITSVSHMWHV